MWREAGIATPDTVTGVQIAGQETSGWSAVVGDTLWIGKVDMYSVDAKAIFNPASINPDSLPAGASIVNIDGMEYAQVVLNGWSSSLPVQPDFVLDDRTTKFTTSAKYAVGPDNGGFTIDQINTFLKLVDNSEGGWVELGAAGAASSADFTEYSVNFTALGTVTNFQVAGQETVTVNWNSLVGDTLWVGKIMPVLQLVPTADTLFVDKDIDNVNIADDADYKAVAEVKWDIDSLYIKLTIWDEQIFNNGGSSYSQDNIEIYLDMDNSKGDVFDGVDDYQFRVMNDSSWESTATSQNLEVGGVRMIYEVMLDGADTLGYTYDIALPFDSLSADFVPEVGVEIGFDILASDNDGDPVYRDQVAWNTPSGNLWNTPYYWGVLQLADDGKVAPIFDTEKPSTPANFTATVDAADVTLSWDAATDNRKVATYVLSQDGEEIWSGALLTRKVRDLAEGTYAFTLVAVDIYDNVSSVVSTEATIIGDNIESTKAQRLSVYPNPTNSTLSIKGVQDIQQITVISITGSVVMTVRSTNSIDVADLKDGMYLIKVQTGTEVYSTTFVKD